MRRMYSEKQIKRMIAESSDEVVESLVNQDVKVKTIEQSEPNWSANDIFDELNTPEGLTYEKIYGRFEEINGVLYIVHCFKLTNATESALAFNPLKYIVLPEKIAKKIIDLDGKSVHVTGSSANICSTIGLYGTGTELFSQLVVTLQNDGSANTMRYRLVSALSVPANTTIRMTVREFITLK